MRNELRIEIIRDRERFEAIEPDWNGLFDRAGRTQHVFQSFDWLWHWANHYLDGSKKLAIVAGWNGDRLAMIWPLVIAGHAPFRRLCWMGEPVSQYGDVLVEDSGNRDEWLRAGWAQVRKLKVDVAHLRKVRADSNVAGILASGVASSSLQAEAPFLDLASARDFASYEKRYSSKIRSSRRRYARRLQGEGHITFEECQSGGRARELAALAMQHKKAWVDRHGVIAPALLDPRFERFFMDVAQGRSHAPPVRVVSVLCDRAPIGIEISLICKGRLFGHVIAHDPEFERKGVGSVLAEFAVKAAHERGFEVYDLLAPADAHKSEWADGKMNVGDWATPISLLGMLYARPWLCGVRPWLKRVLDDAPLGLGRLHARLIGAKPARKTASRKLFSPSRPAGQGV